MIQDRKSRFRTAAENAAADTVTGFKFVRRWFISMHWPARENAISIRYFFRSRSFSSFQEMREISHVKKNRQMPGGISRIGSGWNVDATDERREREVRGDHNSPCRIWQMDLSSSAVIRYHYVVMVQKLISYRKPFDWELRTDPISEIIKDLSFLRIPKIAFSMEKFLCR